MILFGECDNCREHKGDIGDEFFLVTRIIINKRKAKSYETLLFCSPQCISAYMVGRTYGKQKEDSPLDCD